MTNSPKDNLTEVVLLMDFNADELFKQSEGKNSVISPDWKWCVDYAQFKHRQACEFMVYLGGETKDFLSKLGEMSNQGCSQQFISHLKYARDAGAKWAMFHV